MTSGSKQDFIEGLAPFVKKRGFAELKDRESMEIQFQDIKGKYPETFTDEFIESYLNRCANFKSTNLEELGDELFDTEVNLKTLLLKRQEKRGFDFADEECRDDFLADNKAKLSEKYGNGFADAFILSTGPGMRSKNVEDLVAEVMSRIDGTYKEPRPIDNKPAEQEKPADKAKDKKRVPDDVPSKRATSDSETNKGLHIIKAKGADAPVVKKIDSGFTRFEKARIVGARALQISYGAPVLVDYPEDMLDPIDIALLEFDQGVIPISVVKN